MLQLQFNRLARLVGGICATCICACSFGNVQAQYHQTQTNQTGPLGPTIPGQIGSGANVDSNTGFRADSTLLPVLRPFGNAPTTAGANLTNIPTNIPATNLTGGQQAIGLPQLPNRQNQSQDPSATSGDWRGITSQGTNTGLGGGVSSIVGSNTPFSSQPTGWQTTTSGLSQGNNLQPASPFVSQGNGEMLAPSDRMLANDQLAMQRRNQTIADRQRNIANWEKGIDPNQFIDPFARRPRLVTKGSDGLEETIVRDPSVGDAATREVVYNQESTPEGNPKNNSTLSTSTDAEKSMDNSMWWLMVCSVMANLILFYFLYDSRAKYLNLADELQSRFFREG